MTSVDAGDEINFFVKTREEPFAFTVDIYRMGWYDGAGARHLLRTSSPGIRQPDCLDTGSPPDERQPNSMLFECNWRFPIIFSVPDDWLSGVYLAKLTQQSTGKQSYIMFVVRNDDRPSTYLFQSSVVTMQAYNPWGGSNYGPTGGSSYGFLYGCRKDDGDPRLRRLRVSFNRPYSFRLDNPLGAYGGGAGEFLAVMQPAWSTGAPCSPSTPAPAGWEYNMVRWLEREGYDVSYATDIDTHSDPNLLESHRALLVVGHDEFWSLTQRDSIEKARDRGLNLGFFAANTGFIRNDFDVSPATGAMHRTLLLDRYGDVGWADRWDRPENALLGVRFDGVGEDAGWPVNADLVIEDPEHWVVSNVSPSPNFRGTRTGLRKGDWLRLLVGYEADRVFHDDGSSPPGLKVVAHSPHTRGTRGEIPVSGASDMTT